MVAKDGWRVAFVAATKGLNRPETEVGGVAVNFCCSAIAAGGHLGERGLLCVAHLPLDRWTAQRLKMVSPFIKEWGDGKVEVAGHTDSRGSDAYNMDLSLRRAQSVRDYLVTKGIPSDRLVINGYGESQPIADNTTEEGRFQNRRVELNPIK